MSVAALFMVFMTGHCEVSWRKSIWRI